MAMYRVWAECITDCYIDVEANSKDEAYYLAEEADGGDFYTTAYGEWRINRDTIEELEDDE